MVIYCSFTNTHAVYFELLHGRRTVSWMETVSELVCCSET